jgi:hypothetical protein
MIDNKGETVKTAFWHVEKVCAVLERDAAAVGFDNWVDLKTPAQSPIDLRALFKTKQFGGDDIAALKKNKTYYLGGSRKAWEIEMANGLKGCALSGKVVLKSLGDKGGGSFKEGMMLMNQENPNSPNNFSMLLEFQKVSSNVCSLRSKYKHLRQKIRWNPHKMLIGP